MGLEMGDVLVCVCGRTVIRIDKGQRLCPKCKKKGVKAPKPSSAIPTFDGLRTVVPPSANDMWIGMHRSRRKSPEYKKWLEIFIPAAQQAWIEWNGPVFIQMDLYGGEGFNPAVRDVDNLVKPTIDGLVHAGTIKKDTAEYVRGHAIMYHPGKLEAVHEYVVRIRSVA